MARSVTSMATRAADPVFDATSATAFWKELPRRDPVAAQKALCELLAGLLARESPGVEQLQALLALDRRADSLVDALLVNYVSGDAEPPTLEKAYWQAAFELARSFGRIHGHFLKSVRDREHYRRWRDYLPSLLARLFHHRQTELLLRPYVDDLSTGFSWREVHEAYEYAQSLGVLLQSVSVTRCRAKRPEESTLQQEYIHVLVQDRMNRGHFSPHEAFWVSQGIPRWCHALTLLPDQARAGQDRFVVDLNSDEGPVRSSVDAAGTRICFDTAPALASINDEMLELRDSRDSPNDRRASGRSRHLKLLRKVNVLFTAKQQMIRRRGERKRAAWAVEIIIGLAQVIGPCVGGRRPRGVRCRHSYPMRSNPRSPRPAEPPEVASSGSYSEGNAISPLSISDLDAASPLWRLVDRSDSGCRLQGQIFDSNWMIPGTLIAFRERAAAPWTLAIVRRVEKQADNRADIGVEYVGKNPRAVKVGVAGASGRGQAESSAGEQVNFAALFLPESATQPVLPVKTLVLPARKFDPDDRLILRSATTLFTIQLKKPIEEQGDFVWLPFEIVDSTPRQKPAVAAEATAA